MLMTTPSSKTNKDPFLQQRGCKRNVRRNISEILNRPPPEKDADIPEASDEFDINTKVPQKKKKKEEDKSRQLSP